MRTTEQHEFEPIRDTQIIFRQMIDCMARPGKVNFITEILEKIHPDAPVRPALLAAALTLLDREVTFHLAGTQNNEAAGQLEWLTGSRHAAENAADFLLVSEQPPARRIDTLMAHIRTGTLLAPDRGATLIICVDDLSGSEPLPLELRLHGPGIRTYRNLFVQGLDAQWLRQRALLNSDYPTGCDFILITDTGKLAALPRTTQIESRCL